MNLFLHGIGPDDDSKEPPVKTDDLRSSLEQIDGILGDLRQRVAPRI